MKKRAIIPLCLVQFVDVMGVTELVTAMPRILASLHAPASAAGPTLTAYAMCFGGLLMLGARLGDRFGHRRVLLLGLAMFAVGSGLAATAAGAGALVSGRAVQGIAAALSVPAALRLLTAATPEQAARNRALAAWSATGAAAGACGYLLGGGLTTIAGWRAMFWLNLPVAASIALAVSMTATTSEPGEGSALDLAGGLLLSAAAMAVVAIASLVQSPGELGVAGALLALAAALLAGLVLTERRSAHPLIPTAAVHHAKLRAGVAAAFVNTATTSPAVAIATFELQRRQHLGPASAALHLSPFSVGVVLGAGLTARLLNRLSRLRAVAIGTAAIAGGDALLIAVGLWAGALPAGAAIAGAGIGISSVAATGLGTDVPAELRAVAGGALNTAAQLGTAIGVAAILPLALTTAGGPLPVRGAALGWTAVAVVAGAGSLTAARAGARAGTRADSPYESPTVRVTPSPRSRT